MKKVFMVIVLLFLFCSQAIAAGTVTEGKSTFLDGKMVLLKFHCVGDSSNGTFPATSSAIATGGYITRVIVDPGSTAPTALYDITVTDETGADVMVGLLTNLSASVTKEVEPYYSDLAIYGDKPFAVGLTLTISNNSVASAIVDVYIFVRLKD